MYTDSRVLKIMNTNQQGFSFRAFVSLSLAFCFGALVVSGIFLYTAPQCRVAEAIGWTVLGLGKNQWAAIHMTTALAGLSLAAIHLFVYNWRAFAGYLRRKRREASVRKLRPELAAALLVTVALVAGAALLLPPFQWLADGHEAIQAHHREQVGIESPDIDRGPGTGPGRGLGGRGYGRDDR